MNQDMALPEIGEIMAAAEEMKAIGHAAWQAGLMAGFSGNMSMRLCENKILITSSGTAKGRLGDNDFILLDLSGEQFTRGVPSTETLLHLGIYAALDKCAAIVHTHPARMQSLELVLKEKHKDMAGSFLNIDLFEAEIWRARLAFAEQAKPGTSELADFAIRALQSILPCSQPMAVWLPGHGLCAVAETPGQALAISEELEHLAGIQLVAGSC